jgi:uncharacterized protein (DUF2267 family)
MKMGVESMETMTIRRTARRGMMEREEFVGRVHFQLGAKSEEEAVRTVEAYLETLAERLGGFGPYGLSEKLPWLEAYPAEGTGEANQFPRREFRRRVGERAGVSEAEAVRRARLVGEVLSRAAGRDAMDDLRGQLPEEFWELLGQGIRRPKP